MEAGWGVHAGDTRDMVDPGDKEQEQGDSMNRARVWKGCSRKEPQA